MLKKSCLLSLAVLTLSAARVSNAVPAVVTFDNWGGDKILGDGQPYVGGVGGVECGIFDSGSGDCVLDTRSSRPKRTGIFNLTTFPAGLPSPAQLFCPPDPSDPCTVLTTNPGVVYSTQVAFWMNVGKVWQMAIGEETCKPAIFIVSKDYVRFSKFPGADDSYCASPVWVKRVALGEWEVSSPPPFGTSGVHDLGVLLKWDRGRSVPTYYYSMPFHLRIKLQ